jgi:hypothetical protein
VQIVIPILSIIQDYEVQFEVAEKNLELVHHGHQKGKAKR